MKQVHLLLVEDDEVDAESVIRGFRKLEIKNPITIAQDGIEALHLLRGDKNGSAVSHPYLIVLDINMPRMNGLEFLDELRADARLRNSIVFVLTTSEADRDRCEAYEHNVAGYLLKSRAGEDFTQVIKLLEHFWRYVEFPPGGSEFKVKVDRES